MISLGFTAWKEKELYNLECFSRIFITLGWFWWVDMASSADIIGSGGPISEAMLTKYLLKISATSYGSVTVFTFSLSMIVLLPLNFFVSKERFYCSPEIVVRLFAFLWEIIFDGLFSNGHNSFPVHSLPSGSFRISWICSGPYFGYKWLCEAGNSYMTQAYVLQTLISPEHGSQQHLLSMCLCTMPCHRHHQRFRQHGRAHWTYHVKSQNR